MPKDHSYAITVEWTGNRGEGTKDYRAYSRDHEIRGAGKIIAGSSDTAFRGDAQRFNPEELLVSTLSSCHMLWVLHLCAEAGIVVTSYADEASGTMRENADGSGEFLEATLRPRMTITDFTRIMDAMEIHDKAHQLCFIARSVKFPVHHEPVIVPED
ncbi:MAG: OsmC family protein [Bryobacterales bacterium]|nr:OsmC family protein [Bryobacterales bacterium]